MSFTFFLLAFAQCLYLAAADVLPSNQLWYNKPATDFNSALPIGNGRLGAMVYGIPGDERISLNEDSIWSGGFINRVNPNASDTRQSVEGLILSGNISAADDSWVYGMAPKPDQERAFQPLGDLRVSTSHAMADVTAYNRSLDLTNGISSVSYEYDGSRFYREAVANFPTGVLAFRFRADQGLLDLGITLHRNQSLTSLSADAETQSIVMRGTSTEDDSIDFVSVAKVQVQSGELTVSDNTINVKGAEEVIIVFDAITSYRQPKEWSERLASLEEKLSAAVKDGWDALLTEATEDYRTLNDRVSLDLGASGPTGSLPTDERLASWKGGANFTSDPELLTLLFNYGRYLLVGSSRTGSLPSNLQGIWNEDFEPQWDSKFTININLEMNYWPSETANLEETISPLFDHLSIMRSRAALVAKEMYDAPGIVCHHNTDIWGDCAPVDSETHWSAWPMGFAWLSLHMVERYRYGGDVEFAKSTVLPLLTDIMDFFYDFLILEDGYYVTPFSMSPENAYLIPPGSRTEGAKTGLDIGPAMDRQILHELFTGFIELSVAAESSDGVEKAQEYVSKLKGPEIGSLGQILEWSGDFEETELAHRHLSHLFAAYPGTLVHPLLNKTLSDAAVVSLDRRLEHGSGQTGWSAAWVIGLYARLIKGDEVAFYAGRMLERSIYDNLFDDNGIFQIDGNFGFTASIIEMLLQSHLGFVHLGPALPANYFPTGSVKGIVARGGFVVDLEWEDHKVTGATVTAKRGGELKLRVQDERPFQVDGEEYTGPISTKAGESYTVTF